MSLCPSIFLREKALVNDNYFCRSPRAIHELLGPSPIFVRRLWRLRARRTFRTGVSCENRRRAIIPRAAIHGIPALRGDTGVQWYNALVAGPPHKGHTIEQSQALSQLRQHMRTPIRRRQLRGLVLHHRRHPAEHPRRLVNRTASWGEPPVNGVCRWCYEKTASPQTRWHLYCLNFYRVASGQHPDEIQYTLCEICGNPSDEIDHRLAIEGARALGPAAMLRAYTLDNLRWLCRDCHRRKTQQDWQLAKFLSGCSLNWHSARRLLSQNRRWAQSFLLPCSLESAPRHRTSATNV